MVDEVSPSAQKPKHHVTLSDGTTTVGLIAVKQWTDKNGEIITAPDENRIDVAPSQPLAIQTSQGNSEYSDREWPYMTLEQKDWSGGRGSETFEDDKSRYFDGSKANTWRDGELILGPVDVYTDAFNDSQSYQITDDSTSYVSGVKTLYDTRVWHATKFTAATTFDVKRLWVMCSEYGSAGSLTAHIYSDTAGTPNASLGSKTITVDNLVDDNFTTWREFEFTSAISLTATTDYWVVVADVSGTPTAAAHWKVWGTGALSGQTGKKSTNGSSWSSDDGGILYRLLDDSMVTATQWKLFEYKNAQYAYTQPVSGNSKLWLNGDRGAADSNTGVKSTLVDALKTWTVDGWIGSVVMITAGPGSEEAQPWRNITDNDATSLTVSPDWNVTHTTATEYVIVKTDEWTEVEDLGGYVTDHVVTENYVYFARGETGSDKLYRYRWYRNSAGAAAEGGTNETVVDGRYLLSIHHPEDEDASLYIAKNDHSQYGVAVGKMKVPGTWNDLVFPMGQLAYTNTPWADRSITNCTQTTDEQATKIAVAAAFTTGLCAVQNLPQAVDITKANQIGLCIKSSAAVANTQLYLQYDDFKDSDGDTDYLIKKAVASAVTEFDATKHTALWEAFDGEPSTEDELLAFQTDHALYVVGDFKYSTITMDIGDPPNAVIGVLSADYFNGKEFTSLTIDDQTDGTDICTILNGDFAIGPADSLWTEGDGWDINSTTAGKAHCNGSQTATSVLQQDVLTVGKTYKIKYTLSGFSAGLVALQCGNATGTQYGANDTYEEELTCTDNGNLMLVADADFVGDIDDVILQSIPLSIDGDITFTPPADWQQYEISDTTDTYKSYTFTGYIVRLTTSVNFTAPMDIAEVNLARSNQNTINLGALTAGEWTYVAKSITPEKYPAPDDTQIQSVGLYIEDDFGATDILMRGGIDLLYDEPDWKPLPSNDKITNLVVHNGNVQEPRSNPWVFTEGADIYEMQTQNEDQFIPVTIGEMGALRSENTGKAACVNDVYLYFSLGEEKLQRWFNNSLEDVGPDLGAGLPSGRTGRIAALLSYPGRIYQAVSNVDNQASIQLLRGSSHHEIHRCETEGLEITDLFNQVIPGDTVSRLYFSQGGEIVYMTITSGNPRVAPSYQTACCGYIDTGWMYANMKDIIKLWKELKVFSEDGDTNAYLSAAYMVDGDSSWTHISSVYNTEPSEANDFATTVPNNKRIRLRLSMIDGEGLRYEGQKIISTLVDCFGVTDIKYVYTLPVVAADQWQERDLQGKPQKALGYATTASTAITKLRSWASGGTPLTLHSNTTILDDSTVVLEGQPLKPIRINNRDQQEKYLVSIRLRDV